MFTGIVSAIGTIEKVEQRGDLRIFVRADLANVALGESIAINGACLTVVDTKNPIAFDLSAETVKCTAPGQWEKGKQVNLERALKMGDALDGHLVTGHIDGVAKLLKIAPSGDSKGLELEAAPELARFIAQKGSVTLDGVSLTVNQVEGNRFWVNIIPHTLRSTTLGERKAGDHLNLEVDLIARYVQRLTQK